VRAYTLAEAKALCQQAGLLVVREKMFKVDWLWHGWVLCAYEISSVSGLGCITWSLCCPL